MNLNIELINKIYMFLFLVKLNVYHVYQTFINVYHHVHPHGKSKMTHNQRIIIGPIFYKDVQKVSQQGNYFSTMCDWYNCEETV